MQIYLCKRCGSQHDFAELKEGRLCDYCGAPLAYQGTEVSVWGDWEKKDVV